MKRERNTAISHDKNMAKALAVKSNAEVNSKQTCGVDVKVSCREKTMPHLLAEIWRSLKALAVKSNANVNLTQTCD